MLLARLVPIHLGKFSQHCHGAEAPPSRPPMLHFIRRTWGQREAGKHATVTQPHCWTRVGSGSLPGVLMYKPSYHFQAQSLKLLKQTAKGPQVFKSSSALVSLLVCAGGTQATQRHTPHPAPPQPGRRCLLHPGQTSCSRDGLAQPNCCCTPEGPEGPSRTFQQAPCKPNPGLRQAKVRSLPHE